MKRTCHCQTVYLCFELCRGARRLDHRTCVSGRSRYGARVQPSAVSIVVAAAAFLAVCTVCTVSSAEAAKDTEQQPAVVFFAPDNMAVDLRTALEDALTTQLSLLPAGVRYASSPPTPLEPVERLLVAKQLATQHRAVATYWLELPAAGPWLLYAVDARAERMIMRPLSAHSQSPEADIETLALIVRATTEALLHGEPLPAIDPTTIEPTAKPAPAPPHDSAPASEAAPGLRISGAYVGTTFARQRSWQHGFGLRAAWLWPDGQYLGLGFTFLPAMHIDDPAARFDVDRYPFSIHGGLRLVAAGPFSVSGELGAELELRNRRTLSVGPGYVAAQDQVKALLNVSPRVEAQLALTSWLVTFVGIGTDLVVGNFAYTIRSGESGRRRFLLDPNWMRLTIQVGVGIMR